RGEVIGVASSRMQDSTGVGYAQGIFFAVAIATVSRLFSDVLTRFTELSSLTYCVVCGECTPPPEPYCGNCGANLASEAPGAHRSQKPSAVQTAARGDRRSWRCSTGRHTGE